MTIHPLTTHPGGDPMTTTLTAPAPAGVIDLTIPDWRRLGPLSGCLDLAPLLHRLRPWLPTRRVA